MEHLILIMKLLYKPCWHAASKPQEKTMALSRLSVENPVDGIENIVRKYLTVKFDVKEEKALEI